MKAYHEANGDVNRKKIIIPDAAHGTNPASAVMAGFDVVTIPSNADGGVDLDALRAAVGEDTAGLMLTNPNTVGIFDPNILEITEIVQRNFDLRPAAIIKNFDLLRPIYKQVAAYGHFGRTDLDLPWERLDMVDVFKEKM